MNEHLVHVSNPTLSTEKCHYYIEMLVGSEWEPVADADCEADLLHYQSNGVELRLREEVIQTVETTFNTYRNL